MKKIFTIIILIFLQSNIFAQSSNSLKELNDYTSAVAEWLQEIKNALPASSHRTELNIIYNEEFKILQENERKSR